MNAVLIDSDVLIEVLRGRDQQILRMWEELGTSDTVLVCSPVTIAEIWCGAMPNEFAATEALLNVLVRVPVDQGIGRQAGDYLAKYSKSHNLEIADALIAATAVQHPAKLWTRNRKHYPMRDLSFY